MRLMNLLISNIIALLPKGLNIHHSTLCLLEWLGALIFLLFFPFLRSTDDIYVKITILLQIMNEFFRDLYYCRQFHSSH